MKIKSFFAAAMVVSMITVSGLFLDKSHETNETALFITEENVAFAENDCSGATGSCMLWPWSYCILTNTCGFFHQVRLN